MLTLSISPSPDGWRLAAAAEELTLAYFVRQRSEPPGSRRDAGSSSFGRASREPVLLDHGNGDFPVFAPNAALLYLGERYPRLLDREPRTRACALQWLCWESTMLGPLAAQGADRYASNARKPLALADLHAHLELLDRRLAGSAFLAGTFGIADLAVWSWVEDYAREGLSLEATPNVAAWCDHVSRRPAVRRALARFGKPARDAVDPLTITAAE